MSAPITYLKTKLNLPIDVMHLGTGKHETDVSECIHEVLSWRKLTSEYMEMISELMGKQMPSLDQPKQAHYVFCYMVQYLLQDYVNTNVINRTPDEVYVVSLAKAKWFMDTHPWVFSHELNTVVEPKLDAAGNVQAAKGDKKVMAKKVWEENKDKGLTRKQWIELLMEKVGLTSGGASTYHNNLKNGIY